MLQIVRIWAIIKLKHKLVNYSGLKNIGGLAFAPELFPVLIVSLASVSVLVLDEEHLVHALHYVLKLAHRGKCGITQVSCLNKEKQS